MVRMSYEIQSELRLENKLKNAIIQVTEGTINAETEDDLMAAEALAQKTNVPEIQDAIIRRKMGVPEERIAELFGE